MVAAALASDPEAKVRERAAWTIDQLQRLDAVPALIAAIHDTDFGVRSAAGWALVHLGPQVRGAVEGALAENKDADARLMAQIVLDRL